MENDKNIKKVPLRSTVKSSDTWDTSLLYLNWENWLLDLQSVASTTPPFFPELSKNAEIFSSEKNLKNFLDLMFSKEKILNKLYVYAHLNLDQDLKNDLSQKYYQQSLSLYIQFNEETSWFSPELLILPETTLSSFIESPLLSSYKFFLEKILRMKKYTRTDNEELLLAASTNISSNYKNAFSSLSDMEIPFPLIKNQNNKDLPLSHGLYQMYMHSSDRTLRKNAFEAQLSRYDQYQVTLASLLEGNIKSHVFYSKAKKFSSCLEAALYPNYIPEEVYTNLIKTTKKHLPIIHDYFKLKKSSLKLETFSYYDIYAPLISHETLTFTYEDAVDLIINSLSPLGKEYQNTLKLGLTKHRWVDRYENQNKRSGAYSSGCYESVPYILMNFQGTLSDVSTLAHEAGHSMHTYYSNLNQSFHDSSYPIFLAEIASTFNESLLINYLFNLYINEKEIQINLISRQIDNIFATLIRQTMFAEFELLIHQAAENQIPLTTEFLKQTYSQLLIEYLGSSVSLCSNSSLEWARIPHFYYNFYVYQYATGISAALYFAKQVLSEKNSDVISKYLNFLKKGGSQPPLTILKEAGLDMTESKVFEEAFSLLSNQINSLKKLLE